MIEWSHSHFICEIQPLASRKVKSSAGALVRLMEAGSQVTATIDGVIPSFSV